MTNLPSISICNLSVFERSDGTVLVAVCTTRVCLLLFHYQYRRYTLCLSFFVYIGTGRWGCCGLWLRSVVKYKMPDIRYQSQYTIVQYAWRTTQHIHNYSTLLSSLAYCLHVLVLLPLKYCLVLLLLQNFWLLIPWWLGWLTLPLVLVYIIMSVTPRLSPGLQSPSE